MHQRTWPERPWGSILPVIAEKNAPTDMVMTPVGGPGGILLIGGGTAVMGLVAVIEEFLPSLADEDTTRALVAETIAQLGATDARQLGRVMGALMKSHRGKIDGGLAKKIAAELLR